MAYAGPAGEESDLRKRVPQVDHEGRRALRPVRDLERSILRRIYSVGGCGVRRVLRTVRTKRSAGPDHHPDGAQTRLLLFVVVRGAFLPASFDGDARAAHRPGHHYRCVASSPILVWRRREELAPPPDCGSHDLACRGYARHLHASRRIYPVESADERMEWRAHPGKIPAAHDRAREARRSRFPGEAMPQLSCTG